MRLQDIFPYDTIILGLLQVYHGVGLDSFFINQPCIMTQDHIVTTGETYFLFSYDGNQLATSSIVKLIDTFYYNDHVYLLLNDLLSDEVLLLNHALNKGQTRCTWKLFDVDTLRDILFAKKELKYTEKTSMTIVMTFLNSIMNNKPYINAEGHKVLEYLSNDAIILDLPFIMTKGKTLTKGMPYLKVEKKTIGEDIAAIRLLNYQDYDGVIYLNVQDLKTNRCYTLSWNMGIDSDGWWFWSLADFDTLTDTNGNR